MAFFALRLKVLATTLVIAALAWGAVALIRPKPIDSAVLGKQCTYRTFVRGKWQVAHIDLAHKTIHSLKLMKHPPRMLSRGPDGPRDTPGRRTNVASAPVSRARKVPGDAVRPMVRRAIRKLRTLGQDCSRCHSRGQGVQTEGS